MFALSRNPVSGLSIEADFPINAAKKSLETGFLDRILGLTHIPAIMINIGVKMCLIICQPKELARSLGFTPKDENDWPGSASVSLALGATRMVALPGILTEEPMTESLKDQAEEIMTTLEADLQTVSPERPSGQPEPQRKANKIFQILFKAVSDVDLAAAEKRVAALKAAHPNIPQTELVQKLIRQKCQATATVGAVTSGIGLIPGIGAAAALLFGLTADLGATFKLQAELVLEIAAAYNYPLTESEKQRLVFLITGLNIGGAALAGKAGRAASVHIGERVASKLLVKSLPIIGLIISAGTNVLTTYIVGQRADVYFRLGPEAVGSWRDSLWAITGVDEQKIKNWLAEGKDNAQTALSQGANRVEAAGQAAGGLVASGVKKAGRAARGGLTIVLTFWQVVFYIVGQLFGFFWAVFTFIPRQAWRFFSRKKHAW